MGSPGKPLHLGSVDMSMARIARSNCHPDSLSVIIKLMEDHSEGVTIAALEKEIEENNLWSMEGCLTSRALYHRIYCVLKLLKKKGLVHQIEKAGRETSMRLAWGQPRACFESRVAAMEAADALIARGGRVIVMRSR